MSKLKLGELRVLKQAGLKKYLLDDTVLQHLNNLSSVGDEHLACQQWLLGNPAKRYIFDLLYDDLLGKKRDGRSVLDVGGGLTAIARALELSVYHLIDIMAHDDPETTQRFLDSLKSEIWVGSDWATHNCDVHYDVIVANDLFPNVDQRLEMFLDRFLPFCDEMRLLLTFYPEQRAYRVKRTDADEIMTLLAWDERFLTTVLSKYAVRMQEGWTRNLSASEDSLFENGRRVAVLRIRGGAV